ncbi:MAG: hypothetical protein PHT88_04380 [Candidatus Moranbacteria bacterium]|nr:hypothetical protein [Candidatus Moranbacteria bacterium]
MSLQGYLLGLKMSTLFAFSAWAGVVLYIDPETAGMFGRSLFFITLFLWLSGALTLILTWLQRRWCDDERAARSLGSNMRQSVFVACLLLTLLTLQYFKVLAFWNGLLIGVAFLLIELYFTHASAACHDSQSSELKPRTQHSRLKPRRM